MSSASCWSPPEIWTRRFPSETNYLQRVQWIATLCPYPNRAIAPPVAPLGTKAKHDHRPRASFVAVPRVNQTRSGPPPGLS